MREKILHEKPKENQITGYEIEAGFKVHDLLFRAAELCPDRIAMVDEAKKVTYKETIGYVSAIQSWLIENFKIQTKVGIMLENSIETVCFVMACSSAGMICVLLDDDIHTRNLQYIVNDSQIKLIATSNLNYEKIRNKSKKLKFITKRHHPDLEFSIQELLTGKMPDKIITDVSSDDLACILYTTGTTGLKKGVMLTHENLITTTRNINRFTRLKSGIVESLPMRLSHSFGFARIRSLFSMCGTAIIEKGLSDPYKVIKNIKKYHVNSLSLVPAGFAILFDTVEKQFLDISKNLEFIEIGSALMPLRDKKKLIKACIGARICMHYGLTEGSRSTFMEFHDDINHLNTIGKASPGVSIGIFDDKKQKQSVNHTGDIYVKGKHVMKGYINQPDLSSRVFHKGWLNTGDVGRIDSDGYIHLLGRNSEIINTGGLKVAPGEIEEVLLTYNGIIEAAVIGKKTDSFDGEQIIAYIVVEKDQGFTSIEQLFLFCSRNLESYKIPASINIVENIPKTSSGKTQKHLITADNVKTDDYSFASNDIRSTLASIWTGILNTASFTDKDDFFNLGGNSIKAIQLLAQVKNKVNNRIDLNDILQNSRFGEMLKLLSNNSLTTVSNIVRIKNGESRNLFLIHDADGQLIPYKGFSNYVENSWNIYGLQPKKLNGRFLLPRKYSELIDEYIFSIKSIQKEDPYYLGGLCAGGVLAFDIANKLEHQGHCIKFLGLIEAKHPFAKQKPSGIKEEKDY